MEEKQIDSTPDDLAIKILKLQLTGFTITKITRKKFADYYYVIFYTKE